MLGKYRIYTDKGNHCEGYNSLVVFTDTESYQNGIVLNFLPRVSEGTRFYVTRLIPSLKELPDYRISPKAIPYPSRNKGQLFDDYPIIAPVVGVILYMNNKYTKGYTPTTIDTLSGGKSHLDTKGKRCRILNEYISDLKKYYADGDVSDTFPEEHMRWSRRG